MKVVLSTNNMGASYQEQLDELVSKLKFHGLILLNDGIYVESSLSEEKLADKLRFDDDFIEYLNIVSPLLKYGVFGDKNTTNITAYGLKHILEEFFQTTLRHLKTPKGGFYMYSGQCILMMYICGYTYNIVLQNKTTINDKYYKLNIKNFRNKKLW